MLTWLSKHVFFPLWERKDGAHRARYLRELNASQWLDIQTLQERQWERARHIVRYAYEHCAFYRARLAGAGSVGVLHSWEDFRRLPIMTKLDIRNNEDALLSREFARKDLVTAKTGGSTGLSLKLYFDDECQQIRNAAAMRSDQWAGWDIGMKVAAIWGNPPVADTLKKRLRNMLLDRTFYLDTMQIDEASVRRFADTWRQTDARMIFGHSHSLYIVATYLRRLGIADMRPKGIISTSMMLLAPERRVIEDVFGCKVQDRYGCEEVSLIASECERHEGMHLNIDHVVVEFLDDDGTAVANGEEGNIVVTDLVNHAMPLIRYRVEDVGVPSDRMCSCGRGLPLMERVIGRSADFLKRPDGTLVAGVSLVERTLTAIRGIEQLQLVQDDLHRVVANVVKDSSFTATSENALHAELTSVFGQDVAIDIRYLPALDQTRSGKYRFAICNV
jgi:phenylacetate-CoA ligase